PDGAMCKQTAPLDCASTFCANAKAGPTCCSAACNTCTVDANLQVNYAPDCSNGKCAQGASCGQYLCDKNAQCLTSCHCPTDATGKVPNTCKADGTMYAPPECVPNTYCSQIVGAVGYYCHRG